jgi:uncharacterized protein
MWDTIFRPYRSSEAEHSDRSAGDRMRHREKVRQSIREGIADIIAEESVIGRSRDRIIKVPIRGIKEYRFIYGENSGGVAQGNRELERGDIVDDSSDPEGGGKAGNRPGIDYYETDVTLDELINIMFEDLELPDLERKKLREIESERLTRRKGYRRVGIRVRLDKRRTVKEKIRRRFAAEKFADKDTQEETDRFPFHEDDLVYRHVATDIRKESNAVVLCLMDTSGSMDTMKKYLARSFFFLLCQFVGTRYRNVEVVFIAHHALAREVTEEEFFTKGEAGGTLISSAYERALEIIAARYHPSLWNIYAFHCSDGDNFDADNEAALRLARELCEVCNLFGYGEIKPYGYYAYANESSMMAVFKKLLFPNFLAIRIERKEDVYPSFRTLLSKDRSAVGQNGV